MLGILVYERVGIISRERPKFKCSNSVAKENFGKTDRPFA